MNPHAKSTKVTSMPTAKTRHPQDCQHGQRYHGKAFVCVIALPLSPSSTQKPAGSVTWLALLHLHLGSPFTRPTELRG